jgi:hypothetical protein
MTLLPAPKANDPLSLTPNSPQQRAWHSAMQVVWRKLPLLGLIGSIALIALGGLVLLGGLVGWAMGEGLQPSQFKVFVLMTFAPVSAGIAGLVRLRRASMEKVIEKLRGGTSK